MRFVYKTVKSLCNSAEVYITVHGLFFHDMKWGFRDMIIETQIKGDILNKVLMIISVLNIMHGKTN